MVLVFYLEAQTDASTELNQDTNDFFVLSELIRIAVRRAVLCSP